MTVQFVSGAFLFALLIVDIWCLPVKKGFSPGASQGSSYSNAASDFGSYHGAPSGHFSSGGGVPNNAPSTGVSTSYEAVPELESSAPQPTFERGPAPSVGFSSSGSEPSGYRGASVAPNPANFAQPGASFQSAPQEIGWAVAPPLPLSGGDKALGVVSGQPEEVSPPLPPPGPMYQAGELSSYEKSFEHGNSEMETEEQGWLPALPPPQPLMAESAEKDFTSQPRPEIPRGGNWGRFPYYYDFLFMTGQYPPGTVSHSSSSFEQGRDHWQEAHYERYHALNDPAPVQQTETFTGDFSDPQTVEQPETPVKNLVDAGSGQGGAWVGLPAPSSFRQPVHSQADGQNLGKGW